MFHSRSIFLGDAAVVKGELPFSVVAAEKFTVASEWKLGHLVFFPKNVRT